jgi:hypothetical protein
MRDALHHSLRNNSGSLGILLAILLASSLVSNLAAARRPAWHKKNPEH